MQRAFRFPNSHPFFHLANFPRLAWQAWEMFACRIPVGAQTKAFPSRNPLACGAALVFAVFNLAISAGAADDPYAVTPSAPAAPAQVDSTVKKPSSGSAVEKTQTTKTSDSSAARLETKTTPSNPPTTGVDTLASHTAVDSANQGVLPAKTSVSDSAQTSTVALDSAHGATPDSAVAKTATADSTAAAPVDSVSTAKAMAQDSSQAVDEAKANRKKRQKVVRETTVNTLNEIKGHYRSPKQALFMSLIVPGLGQAYVGGSTFNYVRAVSYLAIDVALGFGWYQYVHVKHDRKVKQYRAFADTNWSITAYEDSLASRFPPEQNQTDAFLRANILRENYCGYIVYPYASKSAEALYRGCNDYVNDSNYNAELGDFRRTFDDSKLTPEQISAQRAAFYSAFDFYEIIGKEQEFIVGWKDVHDVAYQDTGVAAKSEDRDRYVSMRQTAERYSRMQALFLGGMVANHIVSAIDAALAARLHNRYLYETPTAWYDRLRLDSRMGFAGLDMRTWVGAYFTF